MTLRGIVQHGGFWWPSIDTDAHGVVLDDCAPAIKALLPHIPGRDLIVQAGACVGVYPVALTDHFQSVVTFEPDPLNYDCLRRNLDARDSLGRVTAYCAALGETPGFCDMRVVKSTNVGAHRVEFNTGKIAAWCIDALPLPAPNGEARVDAIWLDLEGAELLALKGAAATIERFSPTIAVEDKGLHRSFGITDGALQAWLAERGYEQVDRIGRDKIFRRTP